MEWIYLTVKPTMFATLIDYSLWRGEFVFLNGRGGGKFNDVSNFFMCTSVNNRNNFFLNV